MVCLSIDQKKCAGCGLCVSYAPSMFEIEAKSFMAKLKQGNKLVDVLSLDSSIKHLKEIIRNCPAQAIKLSK